MAGENEIVMGLIGLGGAVLGVLGTVIRNKMTAWRSSIVQPGQGELCRQHDLAIVQLKGEFGRVDAIATAAKELSQQTFREIRETQGVMRAQIMDIHAIVTGKADK